MVLGPIAHAADDIPIEQFYMQSCGACHGADGKGLGGAFPPLADSPWVAGDHDRTVKIVLHGLTGPIDVNGKTYNLVMPPQGANLSDADIARLLTYIRSNFGNEADPVTPDHVAAIRADLKDRTAPWTQDELLGLHPLPKPEPYLVDMISELRVGKAQNTGQMRRLKVSAVEEEKDGIMDVTNVEPKDHYGITFKAKLRIEQTGVYEFILDADDMADLHIKGTRVTKVDGIGPMDGSRAKKGSVLLRPGMHDFRLDYLEHEGQAGLSLEVRGPGIPEGTFLTASESAANERAWPSIVLEPTEGEAVIYRNFIGGATARGIGVGYPQDVNLCFSADDLNISVIWRGDFIDAGRHWTGRGQGYEPPAGEGVAVYGKGAAWAYLDSPDQKWPDDFGDVKGVFKGYRLDPTTRNPTFAYEVGESAITDVVTPSAQSLSRLITVTTSAAMAEKTLYARIVHGAQITAISDTEFDLGDGTVVTIQSEQATAHFVGDSLMLAFPQTGRRSATITYSWK